MSNENQSNNNELERLKEAGNLALGQMNVYANLAETGVKALDTWLKGDIEKHKSDNERDAKLAEAGATIAASFFTGLFNYKAQSEKNQLDFASNIYAINAHYEIKLKELKQRNKDSKKLWNKVDKILSELISKSNGLSENRREILNFMCGLIVAHTLSNPSSLETEELNIMFSKFAEMYIKNLDTEIEIIQGQTQISANACNAVFASQSTGTAMSLPAQSSTPIAIPPSSQA